MTDAFPFLLGGAVAAAISLGLIRLGRGEGGVAFALGWWCLFTSGLGSRLSAEHAWLAPAVPILGTLFPAFVVLGALAMTGRVNEWRRTLWLTTTAVVLGRLVVQAATGAVGSQFAALAVYTVAFPLASIILLRPPGRVATPFERTLALGLPFALLVTAYYTWVKAMGQPVEGALYAWLVVSNGLAIMQIAAYIERTTLHVSRLEDEATRSREARALAEARYRELIDQTSDMITEIDLEGRIIYANPAHEAILGLKPESMRGRSVDELFPVQSGSSTRRRTNIPNTVSHRRRVTARDQAGNKHYLECDIARIRSDGEADRIVITSRDVTQRVLEEREREAGAQALEDLVEERTVALDTSLERLRRSERLASMGTLAAGIAHQINNPIGSIRMSAEYALTSKGEDGDGDRRIEQESLEEIVEHAKRCGQIVSSMLQFARNEPTPKQREDLAQIVHRVCEQTERFARQSQARVDASRVEGPLHVFGSAIELEQALLNLLKNACESSEGPVDVTVKGRLDRGAITLVVRDDGRGMERDQVERALEPFYTTRIGRGGTGLGLSVAHGIVTDHGGYLSIESAPEQGTTVLISLPQYEDGMAEVSG